MVLVERNAENVRNGRRSRGPSPNGHGGSHDSSSDDDCKFSNISRPFTCLQPFKITSFVFFFLLFSATKKIGNKSSKSKSEYEGKCVIFVGCFVVTLLQYP